MAHKPTTASTQRGVWGAAFSGGMGMGTPPRITGLDSPVYTPSLAGWCGAWGEARIRQAVVSWLAWHMRGCTYLLLNASTIAWCVVIVQCSQELNPCTSSLGSENARPQTVTVTNSPSHRRHTSGCLLRNRTEQPLGV